jgi:hypothetical protein
VAAGFALGHFGASFFYDATVHGSVGVSVLQ